MVYTKAQSLFLGEQDKLTVAKLTERERTLDSSCRGLTCLLASGLEGKLRIRPGAEEVTDSMLLLTSILQSANVKQLY